MKIYKAFLPAWFSACLYLDKSRKQLVSVQYRSRDLRPANTTIRTAHLSLYKELLDKDLQEQFYKSIIIQNVKYIKFFL